MHKKSVSSSDVHELVNKIITVYSAIEVYKQNHEDDAEVLGKWNATFRGFDDNDETEYWAQVTSLQRSRLCPCVIGEHADLNAPGNNVERYWGMVLLWETYGDGTQPLTREQVLALLDV